MTSHHGFTVYISLLTIFPTLLLFLRLQSHIFNTLIMIHTYTVTFQRKGLAICSHGACWGKLRILTLLTCDRCEQRRRSLRKALRKSHSSHTSPFGGGSALQIKAE